MTIILDDVADPGNAGTILRSARAAGVRRVLATSGSVDLYGPKVVRSAVGAHFWLRIEQGFAWRDAAEALADGGPVVLTEAHDGAAYWSRDWTGPCVLVVGGEARGASKEALRAAARVRIPMPGGGDSVNVALAAGIVLFEAVRQRSAVAPPA